MSSPPAAQPPAPDPDPASDAEMEDATQDTAVQNTSSSTLDNDFPATGTQTANEPSTSNLLSQNRKDISLRDFLSKMDDYAPIIPDAVTAHYLTLAGLPPPSSVDPTGASTNTTPLPLARLLALATQKFVADIAADAYQYSRIRASNSASTNPLGGAGAPGQTAPGGAAGASGAAAAAAKGGAAAQLGVQRAGYGGGGQGGNAQGRTVLTMEDLGMAVQEYGINVRRGEFYR